MSQNTHTKIVILGTGIGGYEAFRTVRREIKKANINAEITIVDKNNYFTFVPLLHEVATGSVESTHASIPLRELVYNTNHRFIQARVESVDRVKKEIHTSGGVIAYDYCVLALGSTINYFGTPGADTYAHHVRTLEDALHLKYALVQKLETCVRDEIVVTIVGGGYTGIEIAGQYATLRNGDIEKLYPHKKLHVRIIDPGTSILSHMKKEVQIRVRQRLEQMGVEFVFGSPVIEVKQDGVVLGTGEKLVSDIVVWAAGFGNIGHQFVEETACEKGRVRVDEHLRIIGDEYCYAIGDIACARTQEGGVPYPQLAEVAHKQGRYVGRHIVSAIHEKPMKPFIFISRGQLMPVGDWYGVAVIGNRAIYGWLAWWLRRTVYVMYMPGLLRKLRIIFDWTIHSFGFGHFIHIEKK